MKGKKRTEKSNRKRRRKKRSIHEASTPDVLSGGPPWSGLYGPVLWLILFINLAARSWKECSERIFSGCPYGDTTTRVSDPLLVAGISVEGSAKFTECLGYNQGATSSHILEVLARCGARRRQKYAPGRVKETRGHNAELYKWSFFVYCCNRQFRTKTCCRK